MNQKTKIYENKEGLIVENPVFEEQVNKYIAMYTKKGVNFRKKLSGYWIVKDNDNKVSKY